jgi:hypothetical protein
MSEMVERVAHHGPGKFEFLSRDEVVAMWQVGIDEALK